MGWDWDEGRYESWGYSALLTALNGRPRVQVKGSVVNYLVLPLPFVLSVPLPSERGGVMREVTRGAPSRNHRATVWSNAAGECVSWPVHWRGQGRGERQGL